MIVLIPAYQPGTSLVELVRALRLADSSLEVLVVDDGSGCAFDTEFEAARSSGAIVVRYSHNVGKGFALKTGFAWIARNRPGAAVVCADSDGQHRPADVLRVAARVRETGGAMVLGARHFDSKVPARSRFGNVVARLAFRFAVGGRIHDTQTGLRGYPAEMLEWLQSVSGDRFEYELALLIEAQKSGRRIEEVQIETVYIHANASSHFRPVVDSVRVLGPLLKFGASSIASFLIDLAALQVIFTLTGSLLAAIVGARVLSATVNFLANRYFVFARGSASPLAGHAVKYAVLAIAVLAVTYAAMDLVTSLGVPLVPAKIVVDLAVYVASFHAQRLFVFAPNYERGASNHSTAATASAAIPRSSVGRMTGA